jgi:hypothetical protein
MEAGVFPMGISSLSWQGINARDAKYRLNRKTKYFIRPKSKK